MSGCPYDPGVRRPEEPERKECSHCKKSLPITEFGYLTRHRANKTVWYRYSQCYNCRSTKKRQQVMRKLKQQLEIQEQNKILNELRTCKRDCRLYPCFAGIDTLRTNLSLTCIHYEPTEHQDTAD